MKFRALIVFLILLGSVGGAYGLSDTVENEPDWSINWEAFGTGTVEIVDYPQAYSSSLHVQQTSGYSDGTVTTYIYSADIIDYSYVAINFRYAEHHDYAVAYDIHEHVYLDYRNDDGSSILKSYDIATAGLYEFYIVGSEIFVYKNGQPLTSFASGLSDTDGRIGVRVTSMTNKNGITAESNAYIDDIFTTNGITGMRSSWTELQPTFLTSYGIGNMYKSASIPFPDETPEFEVITTKLITSEIKNTTVINNTYADNDYPSGFIYWNRSTIFGVDYGTYLVDLHRDGSIIGSTYFNYAYSGTPDGTLILDGETYSQGQTATATYTLSSPDFSGYTYKIKTYNVYATVIDTHTISASSGTINQALLDYDAGLYYFVLLKESKVDGSVSELSYDYATISETVYIHGNVTEAVSGTNMHGASVSYLQGTTHYNTTSAADGRYNVSDLSATISTTINSNVAYVNDSTFGNESYNLSSFSFTPLAAQVFSVDLILFNVNHTYDNVSAYGLIYDSIYHQPINNATVNIYNATWNGSTTSTATGYYVFNDLIASGVYSINASATGYTDTITYSINTTTTNATRQDIPMSTLYTVTVKAKDATSTAYLSDFTATLDGVEVSAVGGVVTFSNVEYGLHAISAVASNYYPSATTPLIDEDTEVVLSLTRLASTYYPPHNVKFTLKSLFWTRYSGVTTNVYLGAAATGDVYKTGATGSDGVVAFGLSEDVQYTLTFIDATQGINKEITLYPVDNEYTVYVVASTIIDDLLNPDDTDQAITAINISVSKTIIDTNTANITVTYNDIMDETNGLTFILSQSIAGNITNRTILGTASLGTTNNTAYNFTVTNYNGQSYFIEIDLTHDTHGAISRTYGIEFENTDTRFGFTGELVGWLAIIFLTWFALTATQLTVPQTAIGVCALSTIMILIGWGYYISIAGLSLAWIISIAANMAQSKEVGA